MVDFLIWNATLTQSGLKGIGVYFSAGDYGDNFLPSPDFPASHPNATAVGGTSLALGQTNNRIFESGWATGASFFYQYPDGNGGLVSEWFPPPPGEFVFGSGGGTSEVYAQPSYQVGVVPAALANLPGVAARVVPDVAMLADPVTGFLMGITLNGTYQEPRHRRDEPRVPALRRHDGPRRAARLPPHRLRQPAALQGPRQGVRRRRPAGDPPGGRHPRRRRGGHLRRRAPDPAHRGRLRQRDRSRLAERPGAFINALK